ncbi:major capsid protein [Mesorhizobium sp.]|uniref:major capsid protein n=1 Tax=Mesorhizobium sp. TaxID=1871066 RepID=UPI00120ECDBD|nr:major capsid protein [Mesorhizobium sp.]TJV19683.1 MAG: major capsid protein [Mesorhizobium sp.]
MLDIFHSDPFSVFSLTEAINNTPFVPGHISKMGLYTPSSVNTLAVAIEEKNGILTLVAPTPRGGPGQTVDKSKRKLRMLAIPHFQIDDAIMADEVQGVRAFGDETQLETVMGKVDERMVSHSQSFAATEEYHRIGGIKGIITYADGTTLDLFSEFGVSQEAEINFDLANANPIAGVLRKQCAAIYRKIAANLDGVPFSGVRAEVGDAFFDDLISHPEVRATYLQQNEASELRRGYVNSGDTGVFGTFSFGDIIWENYRGQVGSTPFIDTNKAHFYPTGAPGLFKTVYGPADYIETVNTNGKRLYMKQIEMKNGKGIDIEIQSNALQYCTRPKVLMKGKRA